MKTFRKIALYSTGAAAALATIFAPAALAQGCNRQ